MPPANQPTLFRILGPGLLFAGAAIGVSHIVQSTRAGGLYGLGLIPAMLLIHLLKYPAISAGARYSGATGTSIIAAYRAQGPLSFIAAALVIFATAIPIQAALSQVTAAVLLASFPALTDLTGGAPLWVTALALQLLAAAITAAGGFAWLDTAMKALVTTLAITTIAAAITVAPRLEWSTLTLLPEGALTGTGFTFLLAFLGWMPAPLDVSAWNSLWTIEKHKGLAQMPGPRLVALEFLIGYVKCAVLAAAFIVLGAALIHAPGDTPRDGAGIVAQLLTLYGDALTPALRPLIGIGAVAVMFSTLLAGTDALPRVLHAFIRTPTPHAAAPGHTAQRPTAGMLALLAGLIAAATAVLALAGKNAFLAIVDFATVLSFLSTPVLAVVNHRLMHGPLTPPNARPRRWETVLSWAAILAFTAFAAAYALDFARAKLA